MRPPPLISITFIFKLLTHVKTVFLTELKPESYPDWDYTHLVHNGALTSHDYHTCPLNSQWCIILYWLFFYFVEYLFMHYISKLTSRRGKRDNSILEFKHLLLRRISFNYFYFREKFLRQSKLHIFQNSFCDPRPHFDPF